MRRLGEQRKCAPGGARRGTPPPPFAPGGAWRGSPRAPPPTAAAPRPPPPPPSCPPRGTMSRSSVPQTNQNIQPELPATGDHEKIRTPQGVRSEGGGGYLPRATRHVPRQRTDVRQTDGSRPSRDRQRERERERQAGRQAGRRKQDRKTGTHTHTHLRVPRSRPSRFTRKEGSVLSPAPPTHQNLKQRGPSCRPPHPPTKTLNRGVRPVARPTNQPKPVQTTQPATPPPHPPTKTHQNHPTRRRAAAPPS